MNKIRICVSTYLNDDPNREQLLLTCIHSLLSQTYKNYEIYIHHDGPLNDKTLSNKFRNLSEKIIFIDTLEHKGSWGFYHRYNISMLEPHADWVLYTNDDNYYTPVFLERMMNMALQHNSKMVYCNMIHNGLDYQVLNTKVGVGYIDMGSFISHMDLIKSTPWTDYDHLADGKYAVKIAQNTNPIKDNGVLFIHN